MKEEKDIGKMFRDRFEGFEARPPQRVWSGIQSSLNTTPSRNWHLPGYTYWIATLLIVAGLITGVLTLFRDQNPNSAPKSNHLPVSVSTAQPEEGLTVDVVRESPKPAAQEEKQITRAVPLTPASVPMGENNTETHPTLPKAAETYVTEVQMAGNAAQAPIVEPLPAHLPVEAPADSIRVVQDSLTPEFLPREIFTLRLEVCKGEEVVLNAGDGSRYRWSNGEFGQSYTYFAEAPGTLSVEYVNAEGQEITQIFEVALLDCSVFIPKAFSPNDDGFNDIFRVRAEGIYQFEMKIFSKWGEMAFQSRNPENGWDGRIRGTRAPAGIYIYQLSYTDPNHQTRAVFGTLTLLP